LVQNLVFYGVSQNTGKITFHKYIIIDFDWFSGSWDLNPYLSFALSAAVELLAYIVVHLILDRIGRKLPYCLFAILFGIVAILILPVQKFMTKDSSGLFHI